MRDRLQELEYLLERSGIRAELDAKAEAERAAVVAQARLELRAADDRFIDKRDQIQPMLEAAELQQKEAQKQAEDALNAYIRARAQFSEAHDENWEFRQKQMPLLRSRASSALRGLIETLRGELDSNRTHYRCWPDPKGTMRDSNGNPVSDNSGQLRERERVLVELIDEAERLIVAPAPRDDAKLDAAAKKAGVHPLTLWEQREVERILAAVPVI